MPTAQGLTLTAAQREQLRSAIAAQGTQTAFAAKVGETVASANNVLGGARISEARLRSWCAVLGIAVKVVPAKVRFTRLSRAAQGASSGGGAGGESSSKPGTR